MAGTRERGFFELYHDDPEQADAIVFGRRTGIGRRGFLQGTGLTAMSAAVGALIPFADRLPAGFIPAAFAQGAAPGPKPLKMDGKAEILVIQERPLNAETPEHMLDDDVTPNAKYFIRNNGLPPDAPADPKAWKFKIDGEVNTPLELAVGELESRFSQFSFKLQLECGGNGRSFFSPETRGNQWGNGAAGCAEWTGVRLRDLLQAVGVKPGAVYTGHYGADVHLSGNPQQVVISRGMRLAKAMDEHTLVAVRMNGAPIPHIHGGPVRLVVPGWAGSLSQKWLSRVWIRDKEHDGSGMGGFSYRTMKTPMVPGGKADEKDTQILESMPVRSIISNPANGMELADGTRQVNLRGAAWAGDRSVQAVHVSTDFGASWQPTRLSAPANRYAWQRWTATVNLPSAGYYEIWSRATDADGKMQPHVAGGWNPQGYGSNPFHRVAVLVKA
jgi:DMSO/TMAO reductase YedYZ molybdopterin-dependent catalytic subunit